MEFGRAGHQVPTPLGSEMEREHQQELEERGEKGRQASEAARHRRPWWAFWRRSRL